MNTNAANNPNGENQGNGTRFQANWGQWPPSPPPAIYNYQAWLAAEGLQVQDGTLPANNLQDSPGMAWNDSISAFGSSDSSATISDTYVLLPRNMFNNIAAHYEEGESSVVRAPLTSSLDVQISISAAGLHFEMTTNGDIMSSMLINQGIPVRILNTFLSAAIMPIIAAYGPWSTGYGFRYERVDMRMTIVEQDGALQLSEATQLVTDFGRVLNVQECKE